MSLFCVQIDEKGDVKLKINFMSEEVHNGLCWCLVLFGKISLLVMYVMVVGVKST